MIGIVLVSNGKLADEMIACVEHILGTKVEASAVSLGGEFEVDAIRQEICCAVKAADKGDGVVVMADIHGSSPANLSICACAEEKIVVLSGMNLPMVLKLVKSRHKGISEAAQLACESGQKYIRILKSGPVAQ